MKKFNVFFWSFMLLYIASAQGQTVLSDIENAYQSYNETLPQEKIYLHIDRPMYEPGETVWLKGYVTDAENKPSTLSRTLYVELINPRGAVAKKLNITGNNSNFNGDFVLDKNYPGGIYKIKAYTNWSKNFGEAYYYEKEITVQSVVLPKLLMKLDFEKEAYGAGDRIGAELEVRTPDNKPWANQTFEYQVNIDGKKQSIGTGKTDNRGKAVVRATLPRNLNTVDGLLNIKLPYQGSTESISRAIPIVLNDIDVQFFPEGGDLVAGTTNKVAFKALNAFGKSADIQGYVFDENGETIAKFESYHQGMGFFNLPAKANEQYSVKITKPEGIVEAYKLPKVMTKSVGLQVIDQQKERVEIGLYTQNAQNLYLVARMGGKIQYAQEIEANEGMNKVGISVADFPMGIAEFTVFDAQKRPHAERLVFLNKHRSLNLSIKTDKEKYLPREYATLTMTAKDSKGKPVNGVFSIAVVDDKLYTFADDKQDNILSGLLMSVQLRGKIEEPNFYFDPEEEKAVAALDLVMLTNGWRRYGWKDILENNVEAWVNLRKFSGDKTLVRGLVKMDGLPLKSAKVSLEKTDLVTRTDKNGNFQFEGDITLPVYAVVNYRGFKRKLYISQNSKSPVIVNKKKKPLAKSVDIGKMKEGMEVEEVEEPNVVAEADVKEKKVGKEAIRDGRKNREDLAFQPNIADGVVLNEVAVSGVRAKVASESISASSVQLLGEMESVSIIVGYNTTSDQDVGYTFYFSDNLENHQITAQQLDLETPYRGRTFYAPRYHNIRANKRIDFRKTLYWNNLLTTNKKGVATVRFPMSDEVTTFRAIVEGISNDGKVGRYEHTIYTQLPFGLEVKMPKVLTQKDKVTIPVTITNNTQNQLSGNIVPKVPAGFVPVRNFPTVVDLQPGKYATFNFTYDVQSSAKMVSCGFGFYDYTQKQQDFIAQSIDVKATGFPMVLSASGTEKEKELKFNYNDAVQGTLKAKFTAYGSVLDELLSGIESMIRQPGGCFEQTSSGNYPNIMALKYLEQHDILDNDLKKRANNFLDIGYNRLSGYECAGGGFEWFGNNPAHEALTAYGLVQFKDMKEVYNGVDDAMIGRAINWLLTRKDGQGGWQQGKKGYHSWVFGDVRDAYITYALSEFGEISVSLEADKITKTALSNGDWYQLALAAMTNYNLGNKGKGDEVLDILLKKVKNGRLESPTVKTTVTNSRGKAAAIETLSFVSLAIIKGKRTSEQPLLDKLIKEIAKNRTQGGYYSTQATVLALKAIVEYTTFTARPKEDGGFDVFVNNEKVHTELYTKEQRGAIEVDLAQYIKEGFNKVSVQYFDTKNPLPHSFDIGWNTLTPNSQKACQVAVDTKLETTETKVGETVRLNATISNTSSEGIPTPIALIGIPSGLSVQPWQMKELKEKGAFDFYEIQDNYLIIYYTGMEANGKKVLKLDLKADIAGTYKAPASSAYLYYTNELKNWEEGTEITIQ